MKKKMSSSCVVAVCGLALAPWCGVAMASHAASASMPIPEPEVSYLAPPIEWLLPGSPHDAKGTLGAVVVKVEGDAMVLPAAGSTEEVPLEAGQVLGPGARVRTVFGKAVLRMGEGQIFVIGSLSDITIDEASRAHGKDTTVLFIENGTVDFDVTSTKFANDVQIKAPDATLAVKGTNGRMQVLGGFPTRASGGRFNTGEINVSYWNGKVAVFNDDSVTDAVNVDPLANAIARTGQPVGSTDDRERDEEDLASRSPGGGQAIGRVLSGTDLFTSDAIVASFVFDPPSPPGGGGGGDPKPPGPPTPPPTSNTPPPPINPQPPTTPTIDPPAPLPTPPTVPPQVDDAGPSAPTLPMPSPPDLGQGPAHPVPTTVPMNAESMPLGAPQIQVPVIDPEAMRRINRIACESADHAACRAAIARDAARINALLGRGVSPERAVRGIDACTCAAKSARAAETPKKRASRR